VVIALRDSFAHESPAVRALFDALVALLTGAGERHWLCFRSRGMTEIGPQAAGQRHRVIFRKAVAG